MAKEPAKVQITLNSDGVIAPAIRSMQLASEVMAIGLDAIAKADFSNLPKSEDALFHLKFEGGQGEPDQRKTIYSSWLLAKGFQELARGVRLTLEEAYLYVGVLSSIDNIKTVGEWNDSVAGIKARANRMNFPDLSNSIQNALGGNLAFADEFRSMQQVRNCLEDRDGVVGEIDLEEGHMVMRLRLPHLKFSVLDDNGNAVEVQKDHHVEKGSVLQVKRDTRVREFKLGSRIVFSAGEFEEMAHACWFFAHDIGAKLPKVEKGNGQG